MIKKNIIISLPLVWCYRNIILGGVYDKLKDHYNIYLAIPRVAYPSLVKLGISPDQLIIVKPPAKPRLYKWVFNILKRAHLKKFPVNTGEIFKNLQPRRNLKGKLINTGLYEFPAIFFCNKPGFKLLESFEKSLFLKNNSKELAPVISGINPIFILSTANVVDWEWPLFRVAQHLDIQTIAHILSFDNVTSRGYMPVGGFSQYLVWNNQMKEDLVKFYGVKAIKITKTGTPQFDFHVNALYRRSRQETLLELGFQKDIKYILYCANHINISPNEPKLLEEIINRLRDSKQFAHLQFVLRLHPMDNYERWDHLLNKIDNIILSIPWSHDEPSAIYWGTPTLEDLVLFSNTLRYAEVMLNIASTVSIDAAITNTPIVCVGYHPTIKAEGNFYHDVHYSEHYNPIMKTGATPLAKDKDELLILVNEQLANRSKFEKERKALVNKFLPDQNNTASERITEFLLHA